jgi:hypothetical protein
VPRRATARTVPRGSHDDDTSLPSICARKEAGSG